VQLQWHVGFENKNPIHLLHKLSVPLYKTVTVVAPNKVSLSFPREHFFRGASATNAVPLKTKIQVYRTLLLSSLAVSFLEELDGLLFIAIGF
jgi:hypothetical protein